MNCIFNKIKDEQENIHMSLIQDLGSNNIASLCKGCS